MKHAALRPIRISTPTTQHEHAAVSVIPVPECQKCHDVNSNEAWEVIAMMKAESQALKGRIEELEGANDNALDLLNGLSLDALGLK
jgi:hypothetical protein